MSVRGGIGKDSSPVNAQNSGNWIIAGTCLDQSNPKPHDYRSQPNESPTRILSLAERQSHRDRNPMSNKGSTSENRSYWNATTIFVWCFVVIEAVGIIWILSRR